MSDTTRQVGADLSSGSGASVYKRHLPEERAKATATYEREGERDALRASAPAINSVIAASPGSVSRSAMNEMSILSVSIGKCFKCDRLD